MAFNKIAIFMIALILMTFTSSLLIFAQQDHEFFDTEDETQYEYEEQQPPAKELLNATRDSDNRFYTIPSSRWPKIAIFNIYSAVIVYVSVIVGFIVYFIGWHSGAKLNKAKVLASVGVASLIGILGRAFIVMIQSVLFNILSKGMSEIAAASFADAIIYTLWIIYISGISVFVYETMVVTAREAHPMG